MTAERFRDTTGRVYAVRVWRIVVYVNRNSWASTRSGGIVCNWRGRRVVARHWRGRLSFIRSTREDNDHAPDT